MVMSLPFIPGTYKLEKKMNKEVPRPTTLSSDEHFTTVLFNCILRPNLRYDSPVQRLAVKYLLDLQMAQALPGITPSIIIFREIGTFGPSLTG